MRRVLVSVVAAAVVAAPVAASAGGVVGMEWLPDVLARRIDGVDAAALAINFGTDLVRPGQDIHLDPVSLDESGSIIPELSNYVEDGEGLPRNLPPLDPMNPLVGETSFVDVSAVSDGIGARALDGFGPVSGPPTVPGPAIAFFVFSIDGDPCADVGAPGFGLAYSKLFDEPWVAEDLAPELAPLAGFGRTIRVSCEDGAPVLTGERNGEFGLRSVDTGALGWVGDGIGIIAMPYEELRGPQGVLFTGAGSGLPVTVTPAFDDGTPMGMLVPNTATALDAPITSFEDLVIAWLFGASGDEVEVCISDGFGGRMLFSPMPGSVGGFDLWTSLRMHGEVGPSGVTFSGVGSDYEFELDLRLDGNATFSRTGDDGATCTQSGTTHGVESIVPELTSSFPGATPDTSTSAPPADGDGGFPWPLSIVVGMTLLVMAWIWSHRTPPEPKIAIKVDGGDDFIEYDSGGEATPDD